MKFVDGHVWLYLKLRGDFGPSVINLNFLSQRIHIKFEYNYLYHLLAFHMLFIKNYEEIN